VLARSIATLHQFLSNHLRYKWRIIIADNGSTDGTAAIGGRLAEERAEVSCFHLKQRGRGRALRYAWMQSSADIVCYMDVDLSTELEALPRAIHTVVAEGYDLVVGSRLMRSSRIHRSLQREIISRIYNLFVKALLFTRFSDAQCGFKAVTREVVERIVPQVKDQGWFFDTELLVLAERQGYRIKDIPVAWIEDTDSRVKILQTAWEDIKGVFRLRRLLWSKEFVQIAVLNGKRMHP
jgi:glycosyltransferase involved in cell wall biosynthesis